MSSTTLPDVILAYIEQAKNEMFSALPAKITSVDKLSDNLIDVQPSIKQVANELTSYELPKLLDVPVQWTSGGGGKLTFPLM